MTPARSLASRSLLARAEGWAANSCIIVLTCQIVILAAHTFYWRYGEDVGFFYYFSWLANEQDYLPYRDLHDTSFPGSFLIYSLITRIGGYSVLAYNITHMALFTALCASSYRFLRQINTRFAIAGTALFGSYYFFMHRSMHMQRDFLVLLLLVLSLDAITCRKSLAWRSVLCGLLLGLASTVKPQAALAAPWIILIGAAASPGNTHKTKNCLRATAWSLTAFLSVWCAVAAWLYLRGVLPAFWRMATEYMPLYQKMNGIHIALSPEQRLQNAIDWLRGNLLFGLLPVIPGLAFCWQNTRLQAHQKKLLCLLPILWLVFLFCVALAGKYWDYHQIPALYFSQSMLMLWCIPYTTASWRGLIARALYLLLVTPYLLANISPRYALEVACLTGNPVCDTEEQAGYAEEDRLETFLRNHVKPDDYVEPLATSTLGPLFPAMLRAGIKPATPYLEGFPLYHDADTAYVRDIRADAMRRLTQHPPRFMIRPVNFFAPGGPTASHFAELDKFIETYYERVDGSRYPELQTPLSVTVYEHKLP